MATAIRLLFRSSCRPSFLRNHKKYKTQGSYPSKCGSRISHQFNFSTVTNQTEAVNGPLRFDELMKLRKDEAYRSVVVEVNSRSAAATLFAREAESVTTAYYYKLPHSKEYLLMEFKFQEHLRLFLKNAMYSKGSFPVSSRFLAFEGHGKHDKNIECESLNEYTPIDKNQLQCILLSSEDVADQMRKLYEETKVCDIQSRLRFLLCADLEGIWQGLFPFNAVHPFGSSVNGFGQYSSDADMVLLLEPDESKYPQKKNGEHLSFQEKKISSNERQQIQTTLEEFGGTLNRFMPGCLNVQWILRARVPILKFHHAYTGLQCDLCTSNSISIFMSEVLYLFGEYDNRVRPLVFTVHRWARSVGVTQSIPGPWLTSFQLTLMVLFYLQQVKMPLLPLMDDLRTDKKGKKQKLDITCMNFVRDINKFPQLRNNDNLCDLLRGFFTFYESFDFKNTGISIVSGPVGVKPEFGSLYIENPLEPDLNVSRNVNREEIRKLIQSMRNALWTLENSQIRTNSNDTWGILNLFEPERKEKYNINVRTLLEKDSKASTVIGGEYTAQAKMSGNENKISETKKINSSLENILKDVKHKNRVFRNIRKNNRIDKNIWNTRW